MMDGKIIIDPIRTLRSYEKSVVHTAVRFILNDNNVQRVSWGTRTIVVDGEEVVLPNLIRKKYITYMLRDYIENFSANERIGNTSFYKITGTITHMDQHARTSVDYVSGFS